MRTVDRLQCAAITEFQRIQQRLAQSRTRLDLLSPQNVLQRGYSITTDPTSGKVLRNATEVKPGAKIRTRLAKGEISSTVDRAES